MPKSETAFDTLEIWKAQQRLKNRILRTPLIFSGALSRRLGCQVYLKMECWQLSGCFKVRGAINTLSSFSASQRNKEIVTASSGNHGLAVAYAAQLFNQSPATVFLPEHADPSKVEKIKQYGGQPKFHGQNYLEAYDRAQAYKTEQDGIFVHSHADPLVIAGQGTIGLEILEDLPDVETILIPIGGGGLVSGVSAAVKSVSPSVRIIGIEPAAAPSAYLSLQDGFAHERIEIQPSLADGLLGGVGRLPFEIFYPLVEQVQLVEEQEIVHAMQTFQQDESLMVEGASSVGLAAIQSGKVDVTGQKIVLILTSRNIDADKFNHLMQNFRDRQSKK